MLETTTLDIAELTAGADVTTAAEEAATLEAETVAVAAVWLADSAPL